MSDTRTAVAEARRVVVKVGSSSLTAADGSLAEENLAELVDVVAQMRDRGQDVVLVTSGAIAAGLKPLGLAERPQDLFFVEVAQLDQVIGKTPALALLEQQGFFELGLGETRGAQ